MQLSQVEINNFGKHAHKVIDFLPGSNMIVGPNYSGKSTIMRALAIGLYGNRMTSIPTKLLVRKGAKDFNITIKLSSVSEGVVIQRTSVNSSITRQGESSPYVVGHTQVNDEVRRLMQMTRDTFRKVFMSEQGSPQQLLAMEGAELQRFVESVTELDDLDAMQKLAGQTLAKAKAQAETLSGLLMNEEALVKAKADLADYSSQLFKANELKVMLDSSRAELASKADNLQADLSKAVEQNKAAEKWWASKNPILQQIEARPELDILDLTALESSLTSANQTVKERAEDLQALTNLNQEWDSYTKTKTAYEIELADLLSKDLTLVPEDALIKLEEDITGLRSFINNQTLVKERYNNQLSLVDYSSKSLVQEKLTLSEMGELKVVPDLSGTKKVVDYLNSSITELRSKEHQLKSLIHNSECPTCHRPFEEGFDKVKVTKDLYDCQQALESTITELDTELMELSGLTKELQAAEEFNARLQRKKEEVESIGARLKSAEEALSAMVKPTGEEELTKANEQIKVYEAALNTSRVNNAEKAFFIDRLAKAKLSFSELKTPLKEKPDDLVIAKAEVDLKTAREVLGAVSNRLTEAKTKNELAKASNAVRSTLIKKLESYPDELDPKSIDIEPVSILLKAAVDELSSVSASLRECEACIADLNLSIQPLNSEIALDDRYRKDCDVHAGQAKLYASLVNLISTHRDQFMARAQATLFEVASEFVRLSSGGDIQEVLVHDGSISYRENDQVFPKDTASGAQKSMIGLGMKLGISNLIHSDFDTFLLDEVSADMSEDISLSCMTALDMLCPNAVVITHRHMDTAGNVITL